MIASQPNRRPKRTPVATTGTVEMLRSLEDLLDAFDHVVHPDLLERAGLDAAQVLLLFQAKRRVEALHEQLIGEGPDILLG